MVLVRCDRQKCAVHHTTLVYDVLLHLSLLNWRVSRPALFCCTDGWMHYCESTLIYSVSTPGDNALLSLHPFYLVCRLYFFLWTMFMVFTGMLFVMVGGASSCLFEAHKGFARPRYAASNMLSKYIFILTVLPPSVAARCGSGPNPGSSAGAASMPCNNDAL